MPEKMGLFDERLPAADCDDVTWLEASLRISIEPQDWPYWATRLIRRLHEHEELARRLLEARAEAVRLAEPLERDDRLAPLFAELRRSTPLEFRCEALGDDELAAVCERLEERAS